MLHRIPIIALALLLTSSLPAETKTARATQTLGRTADRVKKLKAHLETFYLELDWEPGSQPPCLGHTWRLTTKPLPEYLPRGDEFFLIWDVPGNPTVASGRSTVRISEKLSGGIIDYLAREGFFARAKTAAGWVTLKADKPTTVLLAGTSGHNYLCYEVLNEARAKKLSAFVHRTFAEATVIRDARLAAAREVLVRKAIAFRPRNSRADPKNNQNSTGLDFSDVLKWSGQKSFVERFTKAPKPYDDKIDELKSDSYSEQTRVWALCALLDHPEIDVKIRAVRVLAANPYALADAVPALLAAAKSNDYPVGGSESATLHMFYRSTLKKAMEKITREALTPKGLKVITYSQPGKPKTIRSEDNPRYFGERVDFKKVEVWLMDVFLSWSPGVTRELERWGKGRNCYLDLDTGKVFAEPEGLADEKARRAWCTKMGIDLVCDMRNIPDPPGRGLVLVGVDLQSAGGLYRTDTTSERWWDLRASRARALLAKADPPGRPVLRWSSYVFKTREGRVGQLDPFEATDKKLKLRYRLVRPDTAATTRPATQPASKRRNTTPSVQFKGRKYWLCGILGGNLPAGIKLGFTINEKDPQALPETYLLREQKSKIVEVVKIPFPEGIHLVDLTGDGRNELIVGGCQHAPNLKITSLIPIVGLNYSKDQNSSSCGPCWFSISGSVVVYRIGRKFENLLEGCYQDSSVAGIHHFVLADLYGTGQPILCSVITPHKNPLPLANFTKQRLEHYWTFDPKTEKFRKVEANLPVVTEVPRKLNMSRLKGMLARKIEHATQPTSGPTATTTITSAPAVEPAVMAILKRLEAAGARYPNITAEIDYKVDMIQTGDTEQRTGKVYYQGPTKKTPAKFRIHFDTLRQGAGPRIKDVVDYAFDGAWLTVRKERIKQMTRYQVAPPGEKVNPIQLGKGPFPVPFGQKAEAVIKHFRPSTRPVKKSDPKDTDYVKLVTRRRYRKDFSVVWLEMWVERKRGLPVKIVAEDRSENLTTVVFKKIATPKRFPPKTFNLPRPPIGWEYHVERYKGKIRNSKSETRNKF